MASRNPTWGMLIAAKLIAVGCGEPSDEAAGIDGGADTDTDTGSDTGNESCAIVTDLPESCDIAWGHYSAADVVLGSDGLGILAYYSYWYHELFVARCADPQCSSIASTLVACPVEIRALALGADGLPVIAYVNQETPATLEVARCTDATCGAVSTTVVWDGTAEDATIEAVSIVAGGDGLPFIAMTTETDVRAVHCDAADCSVASVVTLDAIATTEVQACDVTIGLDGMPVVAAMAKDPHPFLGPVRLFVARCADSACQDVTVEAPLSDLSQTSGLDIFVGEDDIPLIALGYTPDPDYGFVDNFAVLRCADAACSDLASMTDADEGLSSTEPGILEPRIGLGADGFARVAYVRCLATDLIKDRGNPVCSKEELVVAKCIDASCIERDSWKFPSGYGGGGLALGVDGFALVTFRKNTHIAVAAWIPPDCSL